MATHETGARKTLGRVIRERRAELGLTQEELAERIGEHVRQSDVSRMERDYISLPRRERLEALAAALEISSGYLLMQSGWLSEDEGSLIDSSNPQVVVPGDRNALTPAPSPAQLQPDEWIDVPQMTPATGPVANTPAELRDAITRARGEYRRTNDILRQTADTMEKARRIRRTPR